MTLRDTALGILVGHSRKASWKKECLGAREGQGCDLSQRKSPSVGRAGCGRKRADSDDVGRDTPESPLG